MDIYIGYKYRNNKNKEALKDMLEKVSESISSLGHKTFILDRDIYNWKHGRTTTSRSIASILKNMHKSDVLLAIVDNDNKSVGLTFEHVCAKCLGKKIILAIKEGLDQSPFNKFAHKTIEFKDKEDLVTKLQTSFKSTKD
jgi:predicted transcriptional regulator